MTEQEQLDALITALRTVKAELKRRDKLSAKAQSMDFRTASPKQVQKASADLSWQCMELDKARVRFARLFAGSCVGVGTAEQVYRPSGFHEYKF